ncbi:MAG: 50S ribosomal protein L28 [bacterium]|nr:50S ribosomal protein L28 [bacterium]
MANKCEICGKKPQFGSTISHAHNVTKKTRMPNLRRVKAEIEKQTKYIYVCSRCMRSGKVKKSV